VVHRTSNAHGYFRALQRRSTPAACPAPVLPLFARARETDCACGRQINDASREPHLRSRDPTWLRPAHRKCISEHCCRRTTAASRQRACSLSRIRHGLVPCALLPCRAAALSCIRRARPAPSRAALSSLLTRLLEDSTVSSTQGCFASPRPAPRISLSQQRHLHGDTIYCTALSLPALLTRAATKARLACPPASPQTAQQSTRRAIDVDVRCR
jgi:hypothetical protein